MGAGVAHARGVLSPLMALLASSLLLCCLVTLPDLALEWQGLVTADPRLPGWSGVAVVIAVGVAGIGMLGSDRLGSGPLLALGAIAAGVGLALSQDVDAAGQLVLALVTQAVAVGALFAAGLCMLDGLSPRSARVTVIAWLLPWAAGWGTLGWLALAGRESDRTRIGVHPPAVGLAVVASLLLVWALLTLLLEPVRHPDPERSAFENAWGALAGCVVGAGCLVMLVGFQPDLSPSWARPVVLLASAVVAVGLVACGLLVPPLHARAAYLAVVVTLATGPVCVQALMIVPAQSRDGGLDWWVLVVLTLAGLLGTLAGWLRPSAGVTGGLVLVAAAAAGGWVMPSYQWVMCAAAAPMCLGVAAAVTAGLRMAAASRMRLRFVAVGGLGGLLLGQLAAAPVAWSLGAPVAGVPDARPGGRVLLGLTFALVVVTSAGCAVLLDRARTVPPAAARSSTLVRPPEVAL